MAEGNQSEISFKPNEESGFTQNLSQFYKLHYKPRRSIDDAKNSIAFRAKSVNNIIVQQKNPQEISQELQVKHKRSLKQRIKRHERQKDKNKSEIRSSQKFSFKHILSKQFPTQHIQQYFVKFPSKTHVDLDEYSRKNIGVKMAIQKCKDEKIKIQKVISSHKQSEQTKLDYLQLKKKDIQEEIKNQIKAIYEQYFKKQYQGDGNGFMEFQTKIKITMEILQQQMFNSK